MGRVDLLGVRRGELLAQRERLMQQRHQLLEQQRAAGPERQPEFDGRIAAIDARTVQLDREILQVDDAINQQMSRGFEASVAQLAREAAGRAATTVQLFPGRPQRFNESNKELIGAVVGINAVGLILMGLFFWTILRRQMARLSSGPDQSARIAQLQQSIDVVALEVERISEGQRFVSKVLHEKLPITAGESQR